MATRLLLCFAWWLAATGWAAPVLIVADEFPAMRVLAAQLKFEEKLATQIVSQTNRPADLASYGAVIVYIHGNLEAATEQALIRYTEGGGKLVVLHHSISSGKRKNAEWFKFLGVKLPEGDFAQGGYRWIEPVTLSFVNLAPNHFITTRAVKYPASMNWTGPDVGATARALPAFTLKQSEVYLNHELLGPRTLLLGLKYTDTESGRTYEQPHAGWVKPAGRGWIVYLLAGHSALDFQDPTYAQIVVNAVVWTPAAAPGS